MAMLIEGTVRLLDRVAEAMEGHSVLHLMYEVTAGTEAEAVPLKEIVSYTSSIGHRRQQRL